MAQQLKLEIIMLENGNITVNGPLTQKLICYGLLVAAQQVIQEYDPQKRSLIEVPDFVTPSDLRSPQPTEG